MIKLHKKFESFAGAVAEAMTVQTARDAVLDEILHSVESYYFTSFPSDMYIDIFDFSQKIATINAASTVITSDTGKQDAIAQSANGLETALTLAVPYSWAKNGTSKKMGVHIIPLQGIAVPAAMHELAYINGSMAIDKSAFVEASQHWVPNSVPKSDSLLDKLFYWTY